MRGIRPIWMAVCGWAVWGACSGVHVYAAFEHPYGVNAWSFATAPQNYCRMWKDAHIDRWRVMCDWAVAEPTDLPSGSTAYVFNGWGNLAQALQSAKTIPGVRISVSVFNSPTWAQEGSGDALTYNLDKYADFLRGLLRYCDTVAPGVLEALEIENEAPTGTWVDSIPVTHGTSRRDPSWNVAAALKRAYATVQAHNAVYRTTGSPVLVTPHGIWAGAYHHLDELYQLGCRGYFDRINLHDYRMDVGPADPSTRGIWNFDTVIAYHKHLADDNGDPGRLLWLTEFGWRFNTDRVWEHQWNWSMAEGEVYKASYTYYTLERSRRSGFVELTHIYVGITSGYNPPGDLEPDDTMGLIYTNAEWDPQLLHPTSAYYTYRSQGAQTLPWTRGPSDRLEPLTPASVDAPVVNGGFESATAAGWAEFGVVDASTKHTGGYSCRFTPPAKIRTEPVPVEPERLYEVVVWVKISAANRDACMLNVYVLEWRNGLDMRWFGPPNYHGIVDTRNYPNGWRRVRYMYYSGPGSNSASFVFEPESGSVGTIWVDDLTVKSLRLLDCRIPPKRPNLTVSTAVPAPVFSWTFADDDSPAQASYRIIVGTDEQTVLNDTGDRWDSGWTAGTSLTASYGGPTLTPGRYYAAVKVRDSDGLESVYSPPQGFDWSGAVPPAPEYDTAFQSCSPNPFDPRSESAVFRYSVARPMSVSITVYSLTGALVRRVENRDLPAAGRYTAVWDGTNDAGRQVGDGVYLCRCVAGSLVRTFKVVVLKR